MKSKYIFLLFAIILIVTGVNSASAVSLGIKNTSSVKVVKTSACTSENIKVGADSSYKIVISNMPATCLGKPLSVQIIASDQPTTQLFTGTTASNVTFNKTIINPATITQAKVAIAGWQVPATWVWDLPALYIDASTPNVSISNSWVYYTPTSFCVTSTVSTTSIDYVPWIVNLVAAKYPFNGDMNVAHYSFNSSGNYKFISTTAVKGIFQITGTKKQHSVLNLENHTL